MDGGDGDGTPVGLPHGRRPLARRTLAVSAGRPPHGPDAPLNPPVVFSSTYHAGGPVAYARDGNPTWDAFEAVLGELEGGDALAFASGMAAVAAVFETLPSGAKVVVADGYSGTRAVLTTGVAPAGRWDVHFADVVDTDATLAACAGAALLWLESPTNPRNEIADLRALCHGAREQGVLSAVDNTYATPLHQRPLELGADIVVHSATKLLSGHSDVLMGATVARRPDLCGALRRQRSLRGAVPGPMETFLALRGVRSLGVRLDRATTNALELATRLRGHPDVERVRYPGLPDDPGHERAGAQMDGFGAMVAFEVRGGAAPAEATAKATRLIVHATSLGGIETTMERRARWADEGGRCPPGLIRLSVGCEDVDDLWADLTHALHIGALVR
jgi:cystathionine gamma-synthase